MVKKAPGCWGGSGDRDEVRTEGQWAVGEDLVAHVEEAGVPHQCVYDCAVECKLLTADAHGCQDHLQIIPPAGGPGRGVALAPAHKPRHA